jgi:hypothetical protein
MALVDTLATRTDDELAALLAARPDALSPSPPRSLSVLVARLTAWPSVLSCLEGLDRFSHQLLSGLCLLPGPATAEQVAGVLCAEASGVTEDEIAVGLERLVALGLAWVDAGKPGSWPAVHIADQLRQAVARPAGLGPPLAQLVAGVPRSTIDVMARNVGITRLRGAKAPRKGEVVAKLAEVLGDPVRLGEVVAGVPAEARVILESLLAGRGIPVPGSMYWNGQAPRRPLEWLQSRCLAVNVNWNRVELPREVGLALRGGRPFADLAPRPPELVTEVGDTRSHTAASAAAVSDVVTGIEELCAEWGRSPAALLKSGGLGVREVKRASKALGRDLAEIPLLAELSVAAGLLGLQYGEVLPTPAFDDWLASAPTDRWLVIVRGWMATERWPSLAGQDDPNDKPIPALQPANRSRHARAQRDGVLAALAAVGGSRVATRHSVGEHAVWQAPGRWEVAPGPPALMVTWVLDEAAALGVTGGGALSPPARALLAGDEAGARAAAEALLPPPTTSVTFQADLTALAPGTLHPALAAELHLAADVESKGAATVFRFSEASVRRALDAGRSAEELLDLLGAHATKGVPQTLAYLVSDVGRRHGTVRVGLATSYLRSDDPVLLAQALRSRRAAGLGLRQLAPNVVMAQAPVAEVLVALRADGLLPVEEGPDGVLVSAQPAPRRAASAPSRSAAPGPPSDVDVAKVVAELRAAPVGSAPEARLPPFPDMDHLTFFDDGFPDPDPDAGAGAGWDEDALSDDPEELLDMMQYAATVGCPVLAGYNDPETGYQEAVLDVVNTTRDIVHARTSPRGALRAIELRRIEWAQMMSDQEMSVRP